MTSKLQVTIPKAIADRYRIKPGDDVLWVASGDTARLVPTKAAPTERSIASRLRLFDQATERQSHRQKGRRTSARSRGWTRDELYDRGRTR